MDDRNCITMNDRLIVVGDWVSSARMVRIMYDGGAGLSVHGILIQFRDKSSSVAITQCVLSTSPLMQCQHV